jgi:hypothetical protein
LVRLFGHFGAYSAEAVRIVFDARRAQCQLETKVECHTDRPVTLISLAIHVHRPHVLFQADSVVLTQFLTLIVFELVQVLDLTL